MSFLAKITYYNKKDYHFSFFYLQICFYATKLQVYERIVLMAWLFSPYLCICKDKPHKTQKVWTRGFTFRPGLRQPKNRWNVSPHHIIYNISPNSLFYSQGRSFGLFRVSCKKIIPLCPALLLALLAKLGKLFQNCVKICEIRSKNVQQASKKREEGLTNKSLPSRQKCYLAID